MVKARGGLAIVQDPNDALFTGMPQSAIAHVSVDHILKLHDIAPCLKSLVDQSTVGQFTKGQLMEEKPVEEQSTDECDRALEPISTKPEQSSVEREADIVAQDKAERERGEHPGNPSPLTCPDCGGVLWELQDSNLIRFRCHVGHVYSMDSLQAKQSDELEKALWSSIRALEEKAALAQRMATRARQQNYLISETRFLAQAQESKHHADLIRQVTAQQAETQKQEKSDQGN